MTSIARNILEKQNSFIPTDKSIKYDRQLRLWGNHGQYNLENSRICLINATAVGSETLKNMVLPGVGYFSIIDENFVTEEDIANNFFISVESIGQSRAKIASANLCEINPDVIGDYLTENVDAILLNKPEYFKSFNIVIATNLKETSIKNLSEYLWNENIPLIILRSYGFIGYMRIIAKEHCIFEAHPDNQLNDLRLDKNFEELATFCKSIDFDSLNDAEHSHIPYLVIIWKYLEIWKVQNKNFIPKNFKEKEQLKELIRTGIRKNADQIQKFEENFEEAINNVNNSIITTSIPDDIQKLFEDEKCLNLNSNSEKFWIIVRAIKEFTENEGLKLLPLRGTIPDMVSDSEKFIALQNVYRLKAQHDIESIKTRVERLLLNINKPFDYINEEEIKLFCKNAYFLKVIKYRSLNQEYDINSSKIETLIEQNSDSDADLIYYLLLRAVEIFHSSNNRYPGTSNSVLDDVQILKKILSKFLNEHRVSMSIKEEIIHEICRYGNCELHSISAFLAGCASHESIKLLTNQFVPINNTLIYNGIKQTTSVYEL